MSWISPSSKIVKNSVGIKNCKISSVLVRSICFAKACKSIKDKAHEKTPRLKKNIKNRLLYFRFSILKSNKSLVVN